MSAAEGQMIGDGELEILEKLGGSPQDRGIREVSRILRRVGARVADELAVIRARLNSLEARLTRLSIGESSDLVARIKQLEGLREADREYIEGVARRVQNESVERRRYRGRDVDPGIYLEDLEDLRSAAWGAQGLTNGEPIQGAELERLRGVPFTPVGTWGADESIAILRGPDLRYFTARLLIPVEKHVPFERVLRVVGEALLRGGVATW